MKMCEVAIIFYYFSIITLSFYCFETKIIQTDSGFGDVLNILLSVISLFSLLRVFR